MLSASQINRLQTQHEVMLSFIDGDEKILRTRVNPGKWSLYENFIHLATYHLIFLARLKKMINEKESLLFERYVADNDPLFIEWLPLDKKQAWDRLHEQREQLIDLLTHLSGEQLLKTGIHPRYGNFTITDWTEFFLLHEAHHLFTMFMLKHSAH